MALARLIIVAAVLSCGCHPHVRLDPVDPRADAEERQRIYERLQPIDRGRGVYVTLAEDRVEPALDVEFLLLANGAKVYHADDLLPVVPVASTTARAGEDYAQWRAIDTLSSGVGVALVSTGAVVAAAAIPQSDDARVPAIVAVSFAATGIALRTVVGLIASSRMARARSVAFGNYGRDLRHHLLGAR